MDELTVEKLIEIKEHLMKHQFIGAKAHCSVCGAPLVRKETYSFGTHQYIVVNSCECGSWEESK